MRICDLMYSKDALNIYRYLFTNKKFDKEKEDIIKNILYVTYMFSSFYYEDTKIIEMLYQLFQKINYIDDINNLLNKDCNLNQVYKLFSICEDILQEDKKNKYQLYLIELKHSILNTDINDILYFIKIKNEVDETYEKLYNKTISQQDLNMLNNELKKNLQYLEKYFPSNDIEAYKAYLKYKNNSLDFNTNILMKLFETKKGEITFSELNQLGDLKNKAKTAKALKTNHFENLKIEKEELKQIRIYAIKKILKGIIEVIICYLLVGRLGVECYKNFIDTKNIYVLIPFGIWMMINILYTVYFCSYLLVIFKSKKATHFKGIIGFIIDINWSHGQNPTRLYNIYFPKHNASYSIRTSCATNKLKRKNIVKFLKVSTKKIIIPMSDND